MPISLTAETQALIEERLKRGDFADADELLAAALSALEQRHFCAMTTDEVLAAYPGVREKLAEGQADLDAGRFVDGEALFDELEREDATATRGRKTA